MGKLFTELTIKNIVIKNRIGIPPMSIGHSDGGYVSPEIIEHYRKMAQGGAGLIIQEATCVNKSSRLSEKQLGIWDDTQTEGLKQIVDAVHHEGCKIFVQLQYSGLTGITEPRLSPSDSKQEVFGKTVSGREITRGEIKAVQSDFVQAAKRAYGIGYDGIELHGSRSFIICQFFNQKINKRSDEYGTAPEKFALEIVESIRRVTPREFIVGIRLGGFEPDIVDGIRHAKAMEKGGADFIDVGDGFFGNQDVRMSEEYPYSHTVFAAEQIKGHVSVPVFAVGEITTPKQAEEILNSTKVDMVNIGRAFLSNPNWANDAAVQYG